MTDRRRMAALAILLFGIVLGTPQVSYPQRLPGMPGIEKGGWRILLVRLERSAPDYVNYSFTFHVQNERTGTQADLRLDNETTELDSVEVYKNYLVVLGSVGTAADVVSIFDMSSGQPLKSFRCWWPQMSATGRYVVAVRFYPRMSDAAATSNVVEVFDLDGLTATPEASSTGESDLEAIYPPEAVAAGPSAGSWVEDQLERHNVVPVGFLWERHDRRVVFLDRTEDRTFVVAVDLRRQPTSQRHPIDVAPLLSLPTNAPEYTRVLKEVQASFAVRSLRWLADGENVGIELDLGRSPQSGAYRRDVEPLLVVELDSGSREPIRLGPAPSAPDHSKEHRGG
jgi:hypothetical protein